MVHDAGIPRSTIMITAAASGIVAGSVCWTILFLTVVGSDVVLGPPAAIAELSHLKGWAGYAGTAISALVGAALSVGFVQYLWVRAMRRQFLSLVQPDRPS